jgi:hypothetical protein
VLRVETAAPVFPVLRSSNVGTAEVADRLVRASSEGVRSTIVSVENLFSYATLAEDGRSLAFVEVANGLVSLVWVELDGIRRRVLFEVDWPERMSSPELSPDGRHVAFSYRPFRRGDPQLFVVRTPPEPAPAAAGADTDADADAEAEPPPLPFEPVPFGVSATWVHVAKEGAPDELETLLAVVVPGEREERLPDETPTTGEAQAVDVSDIEEELVEVNPERAGLNLPPLTHVALARITGDEFEIVGRIGGVERPVRTVVGSHGGQLVVMSYSRIHGCGIGTYDRNGPEGALRRRRGPRRTRRAALGGPRGAGRHRPRDRVHPRPHPERHSRPLRARRQDPRWHRTALLRAPAPPTLRAASDRGRLLRRSPRARHDASARDRRP